MTPDSKLEKLPPKTEKVETIKILRQTTKAATALAELKGIAKTIPNQLLLVNAIVPQEARDTRKLDVWIPRFQVSIITLLQTDCFQLYKFEIIQIIHCGI